MYKAMQSKHADENFGSKFLSEKFPAFQFLLFFMLFYSFYIFCITTITPIFSDTRKKFSQVSDISKENAVDLKGFRLVARNWKNIIL